MEEYESEKTESQEPRASKRASLWEEIPPLRLERKGRSSSEKYRTSSWMRADLLITEVTHGTRFQRGEVRPYRGRGGDDFKRLGRGNGACQGRHVLLFYTMN